MQLEGCISRQLIKNISALTKCQKKGDAMGLNYKKDHRKLAVDVHLEMCLNNADIVLIFQRKTIIGAFQGGGVDFMDRTPEKHKFLAIKRLLTYGFIDEKKATFLWKKYSNNIYSNISENDAI